MGKLEKTFLKHIGKASTEEAVISAYQRIIPGQWQRPFGSDGLEDDTLFEFKHNINMDTGALSKAVAQGCNYLRRIWSLGVYKGTHYAVPKRLAVCDSNEAVVVPVTDLQQFFTSENYEWNRAASDPDPNLIDSVGAVIKPVVYKIQQEADLENFLSALKASSDIVKNRITSDNFVTIFEVWKNLIVGNESPQTLAHSFIADLQNLGVVSESHGVLRFSSDSGLRDLSVFPEQYKNFWESWDRPPAFDELQNILARKDQLVAISSRRVTGEFFTPLDVAALAHEYMLAMCPDAYEKVWWDNCCGTGNLVFHVPSTTKLFCSTLEAGDLTILRESGQNPNATLFQFDFLNRGLDELPTELIESIRDKELIMLINPPFAAGSSPIYSSKSGVSDTLVAKDMKNLGNAVQNTYTQFMFRITQLASKFNCRVKLGMFSVGAIFSGPAFGTFLCDWKAYADDYSSFTIHCSEFEGTNGNWPVVFHLWEVRSVRISD